MICVIFTSKLEIPEDGNAVLDDVLDAKQFWHKVYALSIGDFNMLIRLVIRIICISCNRNVKRKIIIVNYTKFQFYVQIKHLIEDHCTDQTQRAERVLSAVSLIFVIFIYLFYLSMFHWVIIHWSLSIVQGHSCNLISHICISPVKTFLSERKAGDSSRQQRPNLVLNGSLTSVKLAAAILWQAAKLSAMAHFDWTTCV